MLIALLDEPVCYFNHTYECVFVMHFIAQVEVYTKWIRTLLRLYPPYVETKMSPQGCLCILGTNAYSFVIKSCHHHHHNLSVICPADVAEEPGWYFFLTSWFRLFGQFPVAGVVDYLTTEISTSRQKRFSLVTFIDTPGLVDGDMKYPYDVNETILWLGMWGIHYS